MLTTAAVSGQRIDHEQVCLSPLDSKLISPPDLVRVVPPLQGSVAEGVMSSVKGPVDWP